MSAGILDTDIRDQRRGTVVRARAYRPAGHDAAPCAIFSHGFGGSRLGYRFLGAHLAARGIASVHVSHGHGEARIVARGAGGRADFLAALEDEQRWRGRAADATAAIDAVESGALGGLDASRIMVAGHSFGAHTALCIAGARLRSSRALLLADPRPRAFVALSPPGLGERGFFARSLAGIDRPVLLAFGTRDDGPRGQGPDWRRQAFDDLPPGGKVELIVDGAVHETFADEPCEGRPPDARHVGVICAAVLAFARAHLLHESGALDELRGLPGTSLREK